MGKRYLMTRRGKGRAIKAMAKKTKGGRGRIKNRPRSRKFYKKK